MKLRRIAIENVRSFLDRTEFELEGNISIVIGPNGGGKTNLLDTIVMTLRKFLLSTLYAHHSPTPENEDSYQFQHNDALNNMILEKHSLAKDKDQLIEIEIEPTLHDVKNMASMKEDAEKLADLSEGKYKNSQIRTASTWDLSLVQENQRLLYRILNGKLIDPGKDSAEALFLRYMRLYDINAYLRTEYEFESLSNPILYLPVNRAANGFATSVKLASFNEYEQRRQVDASFSRSSGHVANLALNQLAKTYRLLQERKPESFQTEFYEDESIQCLTGVLETLGYEWELECRNPIKNEYDFRLKKQGTSFLIGAASSGEKELLTYLFAIYALNVRDALIIVDEPELHLHPKWQKVLLDLFVTLSESTGNQFLLATHSPTFISPESIRYVSRVFSKEQRSHITRLDAPSLPLDRHLFNIVNSQNNERIFFSDKVILVEGISDRIFFETVFRSLGNLRNTGRTIEVINVGGKGLFAAYKNILDACQVESAIIADRDYLEQIGSPAIKGLFSVNTKEIKTDVFENIKSLDADSFVAQIEHAIASKSWDTAEQIWEYIKGHRRKMKSCLSFSEQKTLNSFIRKKRSENVFVLHRGALESYLPDGYLSKDLNKLIALVNDPNFWQFLPKKGKKELQDISDVLIR